MDQSPAAEQSENPEETLGTWLDMPLEEAVPHCRLVLRSCGFRILSEMPVSGTLSGEPGRRHLFMSVWEQMIGASNLGGPGLDVGDHLSCAVVVFEEEKRTGVAVLDPIEGMEGWAAPAMAGRAREALLAFLGALEG